MSSTIAALRALLALDNSDYLDGLTSSQTAADSFGTKLANVGGAVVVGTLAAAGAAITAVGAAAWDAGNTIDEAMDTIATATGAVGPELEALRVDFETVFSSVPADASQVADVFGVLNSRLDVTGPLLQAIATPLLEVTRMLGGDTKNNAELFTRVIGDWNIPLDNAAGTLDKVFVAAQNSGVPLESLLQTVVQYGAPLRAMGFGLDESIAMMAKWQSEGVNFETVMGGLRIATGKWIKEGRDVPTALQESIDSIKNATNTTEALSIASDTFGSKYSADIVDTIRAGKFEFGDLVGVMQNADGAIMETAASTADWGEKWKIFQNKMTVALAPIGESMMAGVGKAMDAVVAIFERPDVQAGLNTFVTMIGNVITQAVAYIPVLIDGVFQFISFLQNNQGIVIGILAALGVAAIAWGVVTAAAAWTAMAPLLPVIAVILLIAAAAYLLYQAWTNNWGGIQEKVGAVWAVIQPILQNLWTWLQTNIPIALQALSQFWTGTLLPALQAVWGWLSSTLFPFFQALGNLIGVLLKKDLEAWTLIWETRLLPALTAVYDFLSAYVFPIFRAVGAFVGERMVVWFKSLSDTIKLVTDWMGKLASKLNNLSLPDWMTPGSPTPWEIGLRGVGDAMQMLSRSQLPTFQAALQLQPEPVLASASIDMQPRSTAVSAETGPGQGTVSNEALLEEVRRLISDLPNTLIRANRTAFEKVLTSRKS